MTENPNTLVNPPRTKNLAARGPRKFSQMKALRKI